jgi:hypothetical protein
MSNAVCIRMAALLRMNDRDVRLLFTSREEEGKSA